MLIQDVIQNNNWKSSSFLRSTAANRLVSDGILSSVSQAAKDMINAINEANVQSTVTLGLIDSVWAEQNLGDASATVAGSISALFDEYKVKTFYGNQWWKVATIQKDLMSETKPNQFVNEKIGAYWAEQWNKLIAATISGLSTIPAIVVGDALTNLSKLTIINARLKKGDYGFGALAKMYMSSTTLGDILTKQANGTITDVLIAPVYGQVTKVVNGVETLVQSDVPTYMYEGVTPIVLDDTISNGLIALVEQGAFAFMYKDLDSPLMYSNDPKAGNGAGLEEFGTKALYVCHPVGFDFIGACAETGAAAPTYAKKSGLTLAELAAGGQYSLKVDAKLAPITVVKVKIG